VQHDGQVRPLGHPQLGALEPQHPDNRVVDLLSTLYLQQVLDLSPGASGLIFGVMGLAVALLVRLGLRRRA